MKLQLRTLVGVLLLVVSGYVLAALAHLAPE